MQIAWHTKGWWKFWTSENGKNEKQMILPRHCVTQGLDIVQKSLWISLKIFKKI